MSQLFSVEAARYVVAWCLVSLGLAVILALVAPLLIEGSWSWQGVISFAPTAITSVFMLMLVSVAYDASTRYPVFHVQIWPWIIACVALLAGVAFLIEFPLARLLRPWIYRRDLPSIIFVVSAMVLAIAVALSYRHGRNTIYYAWRNELKAELWLLGIVLATFIALFVVHIFWLDSVEQWSRAIERDARVNLLAMVLGTLVPILTIGALVGYCFSAALSDPAPRQFASLNDIPDAIQPHDYLWTDYAPRRPFRTAYEERSRKTLPVLAVFALTGLIVGYVIWPEQWFGSAVGCGLLGLLAWSGHVAIIHWRYRRADLADPVAILVGRRAFVRENAGQLDFVVIADDGTPSGTVQVQLPWSNILEFSKDRYGAVFGLTHARPFKTDWHVVKLVPAKGPPLLVAETLAGDAEVYEIASQLANRFGPRAYEEFLLARRGGQRQTRDHGSVPLEL